MKTLLITTLALASTLPLIASNLTPQEYAQTHETAILKMVLDRFDISLTEDAKLDVVRQMFSEQSWWPQISSTNKAHYAGAKAVFEGMNPAVAFKKYGIEDSLDLESWLFNMEQLNEKILGGYKANASATYDDAIYNMVSTGLFDDIYVDAVLSDAICRLPEVTKTLDESIPNSSRKNYLPINGEYPQGCMTAARKWYKKFALSTHYAAGAPNGWQNHLGQFGQVEWGTDERLTLHTTNRSISVTPNVDMFFNGGDKVRPFFRL